MNQKQTKNVIINQRNKSLLDEVNSEAKNLAKTKYDLKSQGFTSKNAKSPKTSGPGATSEETEFPLLSEQEKLELTS